jgi:type I restriction enzyme M protein
MTADMLPRLAQTKQWTKLTAEETAHLTERLQEVEGTTTTDKPVFAKRLGAVPKAIEKALWDVLAVSDPEAPVILNRKREPEPDPDLRDNENVPLPSIPVTWEADPERRLGSLEYRTAVEHYIMAEVQPYVPDAWVDYTKTKLGYEIPLTRHFYKYVPPRPLADIDAELKTLEAEIQALLREVTD